jgi:hypothetical protein
MPPIQIRSSVLGTLAWLAVAISLTTGGGRAVAADRTVLLTVACDSYADLKKQLGWLGAQIDNPGLAAMLESVLLMATQGRGLGGLDIRRPLGAVVTSDGTDLAVHGFVPVKDVDALLGSLQAVIGPVEAPKDGVRRVTLPSGVDLAIRERDGWALITPFGLDTEAVDASPLLAAIANDYTLAIEGHPSRMSDAIRRRLLEAVDQAAAASAAQGQRMDSAPIKAAVESLRQTESLSLGLAIDPEAGNVFLENRSLAVPGSASAAILAAAGTGTLTVATPAAADSAAPAIRGYLAQSVSEEDRRQFMETLDQTLPTNADDPITRTIASLLRSILSASLASGGIDAAIAVDTTAANADKPLPAVIAGMRVKNGVGLEQQVKQAFGPGGAASKGVSCQFDAGKAGAANLHRIGVDLKGTPAVDLLGDSLDLTLAVSDNYAFLLSGDGVPQRVEAALAASGRPDPTAKPIASLEAATTGVLDYAAKMGAGPQVAAAAERAAAADSAVLKLFIRPIDRGLVTRISADAGVLKAAAALAGQPAPQPGLGIPVPPGAGFPIPVPLPTR